MLLRAALWRLRFVRKHLGWASWPTVTIVHHDQSLVPTGVRGGRGLLCSRDASTWGILADESPR